MNSEQIAILGHAFFDGKKLQLKNSGGTFNDWDHRYCPDFSCDEWRIKPDDPKTEVWCAFRGRKGDICEVVKGTARHTEFLNNEYWQHIPSLDKEITLP